MKHYRAKPSGHFMLEVHMLQANCQQCYVYYVNALDLDQPQEYIKSDKRLHINYAALPRVCQRVSKVSQFKSRSLAKSIL